jgi:hypothetical protein
MNRRVIPWLLSVPLLLGGTEVAHWLAFRLVYPDRFERAQVLAQTGHGYFSWLPMFAGIGAALLISAVFLHGREVSRGVSGSAQKPPLSRFALLPPLAFTLQEHLERLFHNGTLLGVVLEPTFMLGLLLQLPFALAAYLAARLLLRLAERVGTALSRGSTRRSRLFPAAESTGRLLPLWAGHASALATGHAERGPPLRHC